jgi:hypothetical protein
VHHPEFTNQSRPAQSGDGRRYAVMLGLRVCAVCGSSLMVLACSVTQRNGVRGESQLLVRLLLARNPPSTLAIQVAPYLRRGDGGRNIRFRRRMCARSHFTLRGTVKLLHLEASRDVPGAGVNGFVKSSHPGLPMLRPLR